MSEASVAPSWDIAPSAGMGHCEEARCYVFGLHCVLTAVMNVSLSRAADCRNSEHAIPPVICRAMPATSAASRVHAIAWTAAPVAGQTRRSSGQLVANEKKKGAGPEKHAILVATK